MPDDFPYRSHGQPITAYASLIACLFILIVANGASLWKEFHMQPFLAAYLAVRLLLVDVSHRPADNPLALLFLSTMGHTESLEARPVAPRRAV